MAEISSDPSEPEGDKETLNEKVYEMDKARTTFFSAVQVFYLEPTSENRQLVVEAGKNTTVYFATIIEDVLAADQDVLTMQRVVSALLKHEDTLRVAAFNMFFGRQICQESAFVDPDDIKPLVDSEGDELKPITARQTLFAAAMDRYVSGINHDTSVLIGLMDVKQAAIDSTLCSFDDYLNVVETDDDETTPPAQEVIEPIKHRPINAFAIASASVLGTYLSRRFQKR